MTTFYHVGGGQKRKVNRGGGGGYFGERKGNENNSSKRKLFPEKSNPRVREEGHLCLFRSPSDQYPSYAVPRIYDPFLHYLSHSPQTARVTPTSLLMSLFSRLC
ncbi:hypothetical protein RJT34_30749 [Clitoria ternatea]|uniref:Uncharacterized protein n=1 Tax=Clitoria ternatea TaxID=43366 RepID=A0AAN9EU38_CLITE